MHRMHRNRIIRALLDVRNAYEPEMSGKGNAIVQSTGT